MKYYETTPAVPLQSAQIGGIWPLRVLKLTLVGLAAHHVLSWKVVAAVFRLIPELRGV